MPCTYQLVIAFWNLISPCCNLVPSYDMFHAVVIEENIDLEYLLKKKKKKKKNIDLEYNFIMGWLEQKPLTWKYGNI